VAFSITFSYNYTMANQIIQTTVDQVSAELKRRGIASDECVTVTIEPDHNQPSQRRIHVAVQGYAADARRSTA
jgi:hypothetical protein